MAVLELAFREFRRIYTRKTYWLLTAAIPPVLAIFLGSIYLQGTVTRIPVAVIDQDRSALSRMIIRAVEDSRALEIRTFSPDLLQAKETLLSGETQAIILIPDRFSNEIQSGKSGVVTIFKNASNLVYANSVSRELVTLTRSLSAGILIRQFSAQGQAAPQALASADPIRLDTHILYNPVYNYEDFLIPSLLVMTLLMATMIVSVLVVADEFREGTWGEVTRIAGNNPWIILAGKSAPHLALSLIQSVLLARLWFPLFGIPVPDSLFGPSLLIFLLISAGFFPGLALSAWVHDEFLSLEIAIFFNTPAFIFSGLTFPVFAMPGLHRLFSDLLPLTHFLRAWIKFSVMETRNSWVGDAGILLLFVAAGLTGTLAFLYKASRPEFRPEIPEGDPA